MLLRPQDFLAIEDWMVLDRKTVYETEENTLLVWWLVADDSKIGSTWHPFIVASDERTILQAPAWSPLPGAQYLAMQCPIFEMLTEGNRGSGKSELLLMDYAKDVDRGYGDAWRGILFRKELGDLDEMVRKAENLFSKLYGSRFRFLYSKSDYKCVWDTGEALLFRHLLNLEDYNDYHGHQYPWLGFEELTQWEDDKPFRKMFSCCRPPAQGVPTRVRANTNPFGAGHHWVKKRYKLPGMRGKIIRTPAIGDNPAEEDRVAINLDLRENFPLMHSDPGYMDRIRAAATSKPEADAWATGNWDVNAGGMFDDTWNKSINVIPDVRPDMIPRGWSLSRSYDHGQSKPFSYLLWAESNGEPIRIQIPIIRADGSPGFWIRHIGTVRGDIVLLKEWYGCKEGQDDVGISMSATKIATGIKDRETDWGVYWRVNSGPADANIWTKDPRGMQTSVIDDFEAVLGADCFEKADMAAGSRKIGYEKTREYMGGVNPGPDGTRETAGLFVCEGCSSWLDLVPTAPRDPANMDELPKKYEDHCVDATRYRLTWSHSFASHSGF
jgi:hypothetical protein